MPRLRCLMLDLKSYYSSHAYQLGLLVAYATLEGEVKKNMEFRFLEFGGDRSAQEIVSAVLDGETELVCASNYAWNYKKICETLNILQRSGRPLPRIVLGGT